MLSTFQILTHMCATSSRDVDSGSQHQIMFIISHLQFSKISGESSFFEDNSHEFLFSILSPLVSILLDLAMACPSISSQLEAYFIHG